MLIKLRMPQDRPTAHRAVYDPALDDIRSVLDDICGAVAPDAEFTVSGFGQEQWPVDVATDLSILLEQLPRIIQAVRSRADAELDFYEQGIERKMVLKAAADNSNELACMSFTRWQPNPKKERVDGDALLASLEDVQLEFLRYLHRAAPSLANRDLVLDWLDGNSP